MIIFGSLCYPNLLSSTPHKLAPRSVPCIFLGYSTDHMGLRCLDMHTKRIILSRYVIFDENTFPFSNTPKPSSPPPVMLLVTPIPKPPVAPQVDPPIAPPVAPHVAPPVAPHLTPPVAPSVPVSTHPMLTHGKTGITKPKTCLCLHTTNTISPLPTSQIQALKDPNWTLAMNDECDALIKIGTWSLVPRPKSTNVIHSMWLYRHKFDATGKLVRYKARFVANGKSQQLGVDCD